MTQATTTDNFQTTQPVYYHGQKCIVTSIIGRYLKISPVGNGENEATYYQVKPEDVTTFEPIEFTRINNDTNGNPRYVCHFLDLLTPEEKRRDWSTENDRFGIDTKYDFAAKRANKLGGSKFHNKQYGGGIVFQSYNIADTEKRIRELLASL